MNTRSRTLARLKLPDACRDNPDLPRKLVRSMLISLSDADEAIKSGFMGPEATKQYIRNRRP